MALRILHNSLLAAVTKVVEFTLTVRRCARVTSFPRAKAEFRQILPQAEDHAMLLKS